MRPFRVAMRMPIPFPELAFDWRGVRVQIVDAAGTGVARWLPAGDARDRDGRGDVHYVVEPWEPAWGARAGRYRVSRDGRVRYLGSSVERLVEWLRADVDAQARRLAGGLRVRADAVVWRGRAILLLRPGRIGTSMLAAALVRRGAARCVEGIAVIDDAGRVHGEGRAPSAIALVVATTYRPGLAWQSRTVKGTRAVLPIIDSAIAGVGEPLEILRGAARVSPGLATLQGVRGEALDAAPRILAALDELLDGVAAAPASTAGAPRWLDRARDAVAPRGEALAPDAHEIARW